MTLSLLTSPVNYQLSKNPVVLRLQTDSYNTALGSPATMGIIAGGANVVGGTLAFTWSTGAVVFTVATTPDGTGTQIRPKGALSDMDYSEQVIEDMNKNFLFSDTFSTLLITGGAYTGGIFIYSKKYGTQYDIYTDFAETNSGFNKVTALLHIGGIDPLYSQNYKMYAEIWMETLTAETFTKIGSKLLDPLDNVCIFDFQTIANANLAYDLPTYSQTAASACLNVMRRFYFRYLERYGNPVLNYTVAETTPGYILKAGIPDREFVGTTLRMEARYQTPGKFLTRQPRTKKVAAAQKEFLYFIAPKTSTGYSGTIGIITTISLKNYQDDIVVAGDTIALAQYKVGIFPVGFTQLGLSAHAAFEDIKSYTVKLIDTDGDAVISEIFTYIPDEDVYIDEQYFLFSNSDGGVDTARLTGVKETAFDVEKEKVQRIKLFNTAVTTGEFADVNHMITDKFKQASGFITKAEADWLEDLFIAEQKFVIAEGKFLPITISNVSAGKYNSQTGKTFYEIDYEYAEANPVIKSMP